MSNSERDFFITMNGLLPPCDHRPADDLPSCRHSQAGKGMLCHRAHCPRGDGVWPQTPIVVAEQGQPNKRKGDTNVLKQT